MGNTLEHIYGPSRIHTYYVGVDGLSMPMILLTALLSFLCIVYSWNESKKPMAYFSLFLLLNAGMMGVFMALDFFLFYIFWEVMLLPMYFLIGIWGGPNREYAAIKLKAEPNLNIMLLCARDHIERLLMTWHQAKYLIRKI